MLGLRKNKKSCVICLKSSRIRKVCYACIQLWENRQGESFAKCTIIAQLGKSMEVLWIGNLGIS